MAKFFLRKFVIFNIITKSFLEEECGTLEVARRYDWKNLFRLSG